MANESIFANEWRDCLIAQYKYVIRQNDQVTLKTLVGVMHDVGFSDDDLRRMAFEATLRADDVADDFVPDLEIMSGAQAVAKPAQPVADPPAPDELTGDDIALTLEETLAEVDAVLAADNSEAEPVNDLESESDGAEAPADDETGNDDEPPKSVSGIQQLSLF